MPCKIKVKVLAGRNLPVMDRAGDTTDAFVEIKFGGVTHKTDVCRKSLNPHWNSTEWYRFEVDESELQDEPLQLRLMDHDTYSANDAIGKVVISLAPLLAKEAKNEKGTQPHNGAVMSGWIPVFDTMHGIRGELNVIVKVELFSDFNKYKTSSCGVQFFHCPSIPPGYKATAIHGFVEELVVNDDPEYQWIDKIRTPRASNEARQVAFIKLSNQVQRLVGLKAAELGANAVVGYQQEFDLEGEAGVVARAIGTAVNIVPLPTQTQQVSAPPCSQQQLKKYLDILAMGDETVTDLNQYFQNHQDELAKFLNILHPNLSSNFLDETENTEEDDKSLKLTRQSSMKSYTDSVSIFQDDYVSQKSLRTISEDQSDLDRLLKRNEDEYNSQKSGPLRKMKKMKKNFFSKRLAGIRLRRTEKINEDRVSLKSNSSEASCITDLKNEFLRLKRTPTPKIKKTYANEEDEGIGMASILARSVIHAHTSVAHTSLACIAETQAEAAVSSDGRLRRTSESEPVITVIEDQANESPKSDYSPNAETENTKDFRFTSLKNINAEETTPEPHRKLSESCPNTPMVGRNENLLKLPGEAGYFGSISSALSGESSEVYTTSDEDDESSDQRADTDRSFETTSSIVQNVLNQRIDPKIIAHMERKLSVLESSTPEPSETKSYIEVRDSSEGRSPERDNSSNEQREELSNEEPTTSAEMPKTFVKEKPSLHFKFHNPFSHKASFSAPSSPVEKKSIVYRSSNKIKNQLSKISKSNIIKSVSHISLIPKKKPPLKPLSRPASSNDLKSKSNSKETVLGSPFLSYTDLLSFDKEDSHHHKIDGSDTHKSTHPNEHVVPSEKVEMYIGSEPISRASVSGPSSPYSLKDEHVYDHKVKRKNSASGIKPTGLLHTAMETILMDKVQSLLIPTSPEPNSVEKQFFQDVNTKLEEVETNRKNESAKKLIRQDSIHSQDTDPPTSRKMSEEKPKPPPSLLQHFHPIMSGPKVLETIPSLPESSSADRAQSLDVDGVDSCDTNSVSNKHAVCGDNVDRTERDKDKDREKCDKDRGSPRHARHESYGGKDPPNGSVTAQNSLNATSTPVGMHRRSSDSDLSVTPKGSSLNASLGNTGSGGGAILRPSMNSNNIDMLEYPFLTMTEFPPGFIVQIGGCVSARSVKLVDSEGCATTRASWWAELRTEMRAHARAARCQAVLGYTETAAICEEVCVLSASGTAAVINLDCDFNVDPESNVNVQSMSTSLSKATLEETDECCSVAHVPYSPEGAYRAELSSCPRCRRAKVPAVLLATCAKPPKLLSYGKSIPITACAGRVRRAPPSAEPGARDISDQLPFLEYELHKLLLAKLRMQGANAIFNLSTSIGIGERAVTCVARGAAVRLAALPAPATPTVKALENEKEALEIQKALFETFNANKTANGYDAAPVDHNTNGVLAETEGEDLPSLDLCSDKDACVLELDEAEDVETARSLAKSTSIMQVFTNNMKAATNMPPQAFMQVSRTRLCGGTSNTGVGGALGGAGAGGVRAAAERAVARALRGALYKLRRLQPAALAAPTLQIDLPDDEIQIVISGTAIPLQESPAKVESNGGSKGTGDADDAIFALDEEQNVVESVTETPNTQPSSRVILTSLNYVCGTKASRRICALRSLFVRETTTVRELGGMSGFLHTFTSEVLAIVRAYTAALGGNVLTSFYITQLMLQDNAHKNQGQCLLSVGGDVVHVTY